MIFLELTKENSYLSLEDANNIVSDIYLSNAPEVSYWNTLSNDDKQRLIVISTNKINKLPFIGTKVPGSSLSWPRFILNSVRECPDDVKCAVIKYGISSQMGANTKETKLKSMGVKTYSIKHASISFKDSSDSTFGISNSIYEEYLMKWVY